MNNADSFVRILFHGLFIIAKHNAPQGSRPRWEIGLPRAEGHTFSILLRKIDRSGMTVDNKVEELKKPDIITIRPDLQLAPTSIDDGNVSRLNDTGNAEASQWIIDMEGREFHDEPLNRKGGATYSHKLYVEGGILYTYAKTVQRYKRFNIPNVNVNYLGRFAAVVAIEIQRNAANIVIINDGTARPLTQESGFRYELDCIHMPPRSAVATRSHFPLYYEVLADRNDPINTKWDLVQVDLAPPTSLSTEHHSEAHDHARDSADVQLDPVVGVEPQVCNTVLLSKQEAGLP